MNVWLVLAIALLSACFGGKPGRQLTRWKSEWVGDSIDCNRLPDLQAFWCTITAIDMDMQAWMLCAVYTAAFTYDNFAVFSTQEIQLGTHVLHHLKYHAVGIIHIWIYTQYNVIWYCYRGLCWDSQASVTTKHFVHREGSEAQLVLGEICEAQHGAAVHI